MFPHKKPLGQFNSEGGSNPTVTLGDQFQQLNMRGNGGNLLREQLPNTMRNEQPIQNIKLQYEREIQICQSEVQSLKDHIEAEEKQKALLEDTILHLKKQRQAVDIQNQKLFQENEKNRKLVENLKIDNHSMEMEIQQFRNERKIYYNNINNIETLRRNLTTQINEKGNIIDELNSTLRKMEREHSECRLKIQDYDRILGDTQKQRGQLKVDIKNLYQKYLYQENQLKTYDYQLKEINELNQSMKNKIYELEDEKKELLYKLSFYQPSKGDQSDSIRSDYFPEKAEMDEIRSFMNQVGHVLDNKQEQIEKRRKNYEQLRYSIACLQENL